MGLLVASVLAFVPGGYVRFVWPKVALVATAVAVGAWAAREGRLPRFVVGVVGVAGVIFLVAAATSVSPWSSLTGRWPRYEGVVVLAAYVGALWLGARLLGPDGAPHRRVQLRWLLTAASVVLLGVSVLEAVGLAPLGVAEQTRPGALLGNATDQAFVAVVIIAVLVGPAVRDRETVSILGTATSLVTLGLSGSRAGLIAAIAVIVVHGVVAGRRHRRPLGIVLGVLGAIVLVLPQSRDRLLATGTVEGRRLLWSEALQAALDRPAFGTGPSGYVDVIGAYHGQEWVERVGVADPPDSPHLWFLQAWFAGGLPLAVVALVAVLWTLRRGWVRARDAEDSWSVGLLASSVGCLLLYSTHFTSAGTASLAAFLVGAMVSTPAPSASASGHPRRHLLGAAAATSCAAIVAGLAVAASVGERALEDGMVSAGQGDSRASDRAFDRAQALRPWDPDVSMLAAAALALPASNGDPFAVDATLRWADRSLELHPTTYRSGLARAVALNADGRFPESIAQLDELIEQWPVEPQARVQRAIARALTGELDAAMDDVRAAERLDPDDERIAVLRSRLEALAS